MSEQQASDATFFSLVHHVLERATPDDPDRRGHDRQRFGRPQLVAPYRNGLLPADGDFRHVLCHDLSVGGFSYLADASPDCEYLVVALGAAPHLFVSAQVLRSRPFHFEGRDWVLVGCRFMSRILGKTFHPRPADGADVAPG